ncbi:MAG: glycoside hydrolase family 43 protein [Bacteroidia bacterium]|nr:glycoside hydrolase family 43 protein [Bacteroidia bacterium]
MLEHTQKKIILLILLCTILLPFCSKKVLDPGVITPPVVIEKTFVNPIMAGSDPWVIKKDSFYYYTQTSGDKVVIWKTKTMSALSNAPTTTIFSAMANTPNSSNLWAPELHFINNKWYVYYTAGSGPDSTQRIWVLENSSTDPTTGTWIDKGKIMNSDANFWAIDGTVFSSNGNQYLLWSGRPNISFQNQNIYIAKMTNPWTLATPTTVITKPELSWEINGGPVNEGPEILKNSSGNIFLIYSASGCWTDDYTLGMLTLNNGADPLQINSWNKSAQPVFSKAPQNNAFGPGHNAFFKSPNDTEDWIVYHANSSAGQGCGVTRNIRIQKFSWNVDGSPNFGIPVNINTALPKPSGE